MTKNTVTDLSTQSTSAGDPNILKTEPPQQTPRITGRKSGKKLWVTPTLSILDVTHTQGGVAGIPEASLGLLES